VPVRRRRPLLLILAAIVGGLVLTLGVAGLVVYNQATAIDRSTPAVVARQFLRATLTEKDPRQIGLFVCVGWPADKALSESASSADPSAEVSWAVTTVEQRDADHAIVNVRIRYALGSGAVVAEQIEQWRLGAIRQDGWRICSLERGSSLNP
jgi:hypothetical protein